MANLLDLAMLILASLGALAFGILTAYALLRVVFALMRAPRRSALLKTQTEAARVS
jgi:predicted membrane protein